MFSEWQSIYIGSNPSATTVVTNTGTGALNARNNITLGKSTLSVVTTGDKNNAIGHNALKLVTTGYNNVGFGYAAGSKVTVGFDNVMIGYQAGFKSTNAKWNVFVGKGSGLAVITGFKNTMIGNGANTNGTTAGAAQNRTAIGAGAKASTNNTVVLGDTNANMQIWAGTGKQGDVFATDGNFSGTITGNVTGDLTGNADTATALSTAIGLNDLSDSSYALSSYNLTLGKNADVNGKSNVTLLGDYSYALINNSVILGSSDKTRVFMSSDYGASVYSSGYFYTSDRRFKTGIRDINNSLKNLSNIKPKTYENIDTGRTDIGVIAQDLREVYPELVQELPYGKEGETRLLVNYTGLIPVLIDAVNRQQVMIEELQENVDEIDELKEELESLKQLIINNN